MLCSGKQNPSLTLQVSGTVKGGLKDTMCHGSATKNTQAAGSEATPQLASCHLLILYTFHVSPGGHREYEARRLIFFFWYCFSFLWCCGFVLLDKCSTTGLYIQPPYLKHILFLFVCLFMCVDVHTEVRALALGVGDLLPPCGIQGLNSCHQAIRQEPLYPLSHLRTPRP